MFQGGFRGVSGGFQGGFRGVVVRVKMVVPLCHVLVRFVAAHVAHEPWRGLGVQGCGLGFDILDLVFWF